MNSTELPKKRTHIRNHNSNAVLQYRLEQALKHPTLADSPQKQRVLQFIVDDFDDFDDFDNDPANPANRGEPALSSVPYQEPPAPYADIFSWPTDEEAAEAAILAAEIQASEDWRKGIEDTRNPSLSQRMADKFKGDDK